MLDEPISPMLLSPGRDPFDSPDHLYEIKWDGTRCLLFAERSRIRLQNRRLVDVSFRYPEITVLGRQIKAKDAILDGELVALTGGKPDFYKLLKRARMQRPAKIELCSRKIPVTYVVFDVLYLNGRKCIDMPLYRRRELIEGIIEQSARIAISQSFSEHGRRLFEEACRLELEGIVAKSLTAHM